MKKVFAGVLVLAVLLMVSSCITYDMTNNKVGWSNNADISVKDFDVVGIIRLESQEVSEYSPFGIFRGYKGSRIVWSDLMEEAARMGADDVINVRIEMTNQNKRIPGIFEFFVGYTNTWKYKATALAIKYTDAIDRVQSGKVDNLKGQDN